MNRLTAYRVFGNSGYCPVKSTRIYKDRFYMVELQDIERDYRTDYIGLADTSTIYLFDGVKAKKERDSRLNHCNRIAEYKGNIYTVTSNKLRISEFYPDMQSAIDAKCKHELYISDCLRKAIIELDKQSNRTDDEIIAFYGKCSDWHGVLAERQRIADSRTSNIKYWQSDITITQIR